MFRNNLFAISICAVLFYQQVSAVGPVRTFIQTNFVGLPVIHENREWYFDPEVSLRRRKQFEQLNGVKGEKLIERLGLGVDGYEEQRLEKQKKRDEGHLGGLNYSRP